MNPLIHLLILDIKPKFEKHIYSTDKYPKVHHVMKELEVLKWYLALEKPKISNTSIYDYMQWIRQVRKFIYPECPYKVCRKKTPKSEHGFANLTLEQFMINYRKDLIA